MSTPDQNMRAVAEERLAYLTMLQLRTQRRRSPDAKPWRDPRQGQGRVLAILAMKPEITQRELTYLLGMSRQSLAELLGKLERQGLIERQPSETDRRVVLVRLTEEGQRAAEEAETPATSASALLDCLDDDEVANLCDYLGRIIDSIEEHMGEAAEQLRQMHSEFMHGRGGGGRRGGHPHRDFPGRPGFGGFGPYGAYGRGPRREDHGFYDDEED